MPNGEGVREWLYLFAVYVYTCKTKGLAEIDTILFTALGCTGDPHENMV